MKSVHIIEFIDEHGIEGIAADDRERIEVHAAECGECADAVLAARFASAMVRSRCETVRPEPSPFFESRVLNAIRERQSAVKSSFWSFARWWQSSYGLVAAMVVVLASLGILTAIAPSGDSQPDVSNYSLYSTDADILNQRSMREMTREQMIEVIYSERKDQGKR